MKRPRRQIASRPIHFRPFGRAAMLAYQSKSGGPIRYHAFKNAERIEVSADGTKILIHCKVKHGEIQN